MWVTEPDSDPLEEWCALLTAEPFLQTCIFVFINNATALLILIWHIMVPKPIVYSVRPDCFYNKQKLFSNKSRNFWNEYFYWVLVKKKKRFIMEILFQYIHHYLWEKCWFSAKSHGSVLLKLCLKFYRILKPWQTLNVFPGNLKIFSLMPQGIQVSYRQKNICISTCTWLIN